MGLRPAPRNKSYMRRHPREGGGQDLGGFANRPYKVTQVIFRRAKRGIFLCPRPVYSTRVGAGFLVSLGMTGKFEAVALTVEVTFTSAGRASPKKTGLEAGAAKFAVAEAMDVSRKDVKNRGNELC